MAVIAIEGFDYYPSITGSLGLYNRWKTINSLTSQATLVPGRFPDGQAMQLGNANGQSVLNFPNVSNTTVGFAINYTSLYPGKVKLLSFFKMDDTYREQFSIYYDPGTSSFEFRTGGSGIIGNSDPVTINTGTWYYFEIELGIHASSGQIKFFVDGLQRASFTNVNTEYYTAYPGANALGFNCYQNFKYDIDDLYVTNTLGVLGPTRVIMTYPDSDTVQKDFSNSVGNGTNFSKINSLRADLNDFIRSDATGAKDIYGMSDLPYNPVKIHAIQPVIGARKDKMNPRTLQLVLQSGSNTSNGGEINLVESTTDFTLHFDTIREADPNTNQTWTTQGVNDLKIGPEII